MELVQNLEPLKHRKLVGFLYELHKRTARDPTLGEPLRIQGDIFWTDLPSFGYTEVETWRDFSGGLKLRNEQRRRWLELTTCIAQLNQTAGVSYEPPLDRGYNF